MRSFEEALKKFMAENDVRGEHMSFAQSCHSVEDAAKAANANQDDFVKNICMIGEGGQFLIAIVKGEDRASTSRVADALGIERPRLATQEEILTRTGFPCGGTPSFGFEATFLIDPRVMEKEIIYTGGGSEQSLVKITPQELIKANHGKVIRVRK